MEQLVEVLLIKGTTAGSHSLEALILEGQFPGLLIHKQPYLLLVLDFGTLNLSTHPITSVSVATKDESPTSISLSYKYMH